jgi:hypothetical protein
MFGISEIASDVSMKTPLSLSSDSLARPRTITAQELGA